MQKINQKLLNALYKKSGLKKSQVYRLINATTKESFIERNLAALIVASNQGVNIQKYSTSEELQKIRQSITPIVVPQKSDIIPSSKSKNKIRNVKVEKGYPDPFIDASVISSAYNNAALYPITYIFENSVRNVISVVMQNEHGDDWWEQKIHPTIKQSVKNRQAEEKQYPWHSQRGSLPIFYTDISDLKKIINTFNKEFKKAFGKIAKVEMWIDEIENTRNILAHNNPVSQKDRNRLALYAKDWSDLAKKIFEEQM